MAISTSDNSKYMFPSRLLFWVDPVKQRIERSTLAGTERQVIVSGSNTESPRAVTADLREKRLYWVDHSFGTIESASYSGSERKVHFYDGIDRTYVGLATSTVCFLLCLVSV